MKQKAAYGGLFASLRDPMTSRKRLAASRVAAIRYLAGSAGFRTAVFRSSLAIMR